MTSTPFDPLELELAHFRSILDDLIAKGNEGKWALVAGQKLIGTFDSSQNASEHGFRMFGRKRTFLVRRVSKEPESTQLTTFAVGAFGGHRSA